MDSAATAPQEIELKLAIDPTALLRLKRHAALLAVAAGPARSARVSSVYYDTPQFDLRDAGVGLRVRRAGRRWLQTLKGAGSAAAGLYQRPEYEWPLTVPRLDHATFAATPWQKLLESASVRDALKPVFHTQITRTSLPLAFADGTRAVLCIDVGFVRAGRRRTAINEIEIELSAGHARPLFDLAQVLAGDLPLALAASSKAEQGYRLVEQRSAQPVRARAVPLGADTSVAQALAAIAGDCLAQIGGNAEGVALGTDTEFLHQMRIGARRLRSLIRLIRGIKAMELPAPLAEELRWLAASLGPARDWDVFVDEVLPPIARHFSARRELTSIRIRAARRRAQQRASAQAAVASPRFLQVLLALGGFFASLADAPATPDAPPPALAFATALLAAREQKLRKLGKRLASATSTERHEVRIAAKKLRYAAEFFAPLFPDRRARTYVRSLSRLQSTLGVLNDVAAAERLLAELAPPESTRAPRVVYAAGLARGWMAASQAGGIGAVDKAWRAFARRKPFWN
ncbi:MAG: CHAD domain-containing protein [Casimicrobiaceae bacterium]